MHAHTCAHAHTHTHAHTYAHTHTHTNTHTHTHTHTSAHTDTHMLTHTPSNICIHTDTNTHAFDECINKNLIINKHSTGSLHVIFLLPATNLIRTHLHSFGNDDSGGFDVTSDL